MEENIREKFYPAENGEFWIFQRLKEKKKKQRIEYNWMDRATITEKGVCSW